MSNKYRLFILILVSVILINFIYNEQVQAEPISISAGMYVFLQACYAAGLTYLGGQAVTKVTKESKELYDEWVKFINNKPPEKRPPSNWEKTAILTMLGLQLGDSFKRLVDSVKDFFQELGSKEGENSINISYPQNGYLNGFKYDIVNKIENVEKYGWFNSEIIINDSYKFSLYSIGSNYHFSSPSFPYLNIYKLENNEVVIDFIMNIPVVRFHAYGTVSENLEIKKIIYTKQILSTTDIEDSPKDGIRYIFDGGTYQFTNNPDDIKPVSPNLSVLPKEKLIEENGQLIYTGTPEDLVNDLVSNADPKNLFEPSPKKLERDPLGNIIIGSKPKPNPEEGAVELPYPDIEETDYEIPTGLGKIIALLKQSINWFSKLFNGIINLPSKLLEGLKELFIIPDGYFGGKNNLIIDKFNDKFNPDVYFNLFNNIGSFSPKPLPDIYFFDYKVVDSSYANEFGLNVRGWLRGVLYIMLALYNLNNIYILVRGTGFVDVKAKNEAMYGPTEKRRKG